ncbi:MAG: hypothetical protein UT64_C0038G0007, partial [Candidatus Falkowbacteria bacterium GW2011_GWF2_39_8]
EVDWSSGYQLSWNAKADYPNQFNNTNFKVRLKADDGEGANNTKTSEAAVTPVTTTTVSVVAGDVPVKEVLQVGCDHLRPSSELGHPDFSDEEELGALMAKVKAGASGLIEVTNVEGRFEIRTLDGFKLWLANFYVNPTGKVDVVVVEERQIVILPSREDRMSDASLIAECMGGAPGKKRVSDAASVPSSVQPPPSISSIPDKPEPPIPPVNTGNETVSPPPPSSPSEVGAVEEQLVSSADPNTGAPSLDEGAPEGSGEVLPESGSATGATERSAEQTDVSIVLPAGSASAQDVPPVSESSSSDRDTTSSGKKQRRKKKSAPAEVIDAAPGVEEPASVEEAKEVSSGEVVIPEIVKEAGATEPFSQPDITTSSSNAALETADPSATADGQADEVVPPTSSGEQGAASSANTEVPIPGTKTDSPAPETVEIAADHVHTLILTEVTTSPATVAIDFQLEEGLEICTGTFPCPHHHAITKEECEKVSRFCNGTCDSPWYKEKDEPDTFDEDPGEKFLPLEQIIPCRFLPEVSYSEQEIRLLADQFAAFEYEPIEVTPSAEGNCFELLVETRFLLAAELAGLKNVRVDISFFDTELDHQYFMYVRCKALFTDPELARFFRVLREEGSVTYREMAKEFNLTKTEVFNRVAFLSRLVPAVLKQMDRSVPQEQRLTYEEAIRLMKLEPIRQRSELEKWKKRIQAQ